MKKRDKNGQFIFTTGSTKYKKKQHKGRPIDKHRLVFYKELGLDFIERRFVVHHIDENKKNNNIDNLALMTITAHNRLHAHPSWNKGLTVAKDKRMKKLMEKAVGERLKNYLPKLKETSRLKQEGKTISEIAIIQKICSRQVHTRLKRYKEITNYNIENL